VGHIEPDEAYDPLNKDAGLKARHHELRGSMA
jgi:hypothetical protein